MNKFYEKKRKRKRNKLKNPIRNWNRHRHRKISGQWIARRKLFYFIHRKSVLTKKYNGTLPLSSFDPLECIRSPLLTIFSARLKRLIIFYWWFFSLQVNAALEAHPTIELLSPLYFKTVNIHWRFDVGY